MNRILTLTIAAAFAASCLAQDAGKDDAASSGDAKDEAARQWNTVVLKVEGMT